MHQKVYLVFQRSQVSLNGVESALKDHDCGKVLHVGDFLNTEQKAGLLRDPQLNTKERDHDILRILQNTRTITFPCAYFTLSHRNYFVIHVSYLGLMDTSVELLESQSFV